MVVTLKKVLISDEVDARCAEILQTNGIEVVKNIKLSKEDLIAEIGVSLILWIFQNITLLLFPHVLVNFPHVCMWLSAQ